MAHAIQVRTRAVELIKEGHTQEFVSRILKVGTTSIKRWKNQIETQGEIRCNYDVSNRVATKIPREKLTAYYEENPDAFLKEAGIHFNCTAPAVHYACERCKITYKKKEPRCKEQKVNDREKFAEAIKDLDENTLCWVDECGVDKHYHRNYGRSLRGKRIYASIPGKKYKRTNIIAGYLRGKVAAPFQYDATTDCDLVEGWFEQHLLKALPKGTTIPIDNAPFHRMDMLRDIVESAGCHLIALPTYSPDLNKIEHALWANMKNYLRNYSKNFSSIEDALSDYFQLK